MLKQSCPKCGSHHTTIHFILYPDKRVMNDGKLECRDCGEIFIPTTFAYTFGRGTTE